MKKTILAAVISSVSFGALAKDEGIHLPEYPEVSNPSWEFDSNNLGSVRVNDNNGAIRITGDNGNKVRILSDNTVRVNGQKTDFTFKQGSGIVDAKGNTVVGVEHSLENGTRNITFNGEKHQGDITVGVTEDGTIYRTENLGGEKPATPEVTPPVGNPAEKPNDKELERPEMPPATNPDLPVRDAIESTRTSYQNDLAATNDRIDNLEAAFEQQAHQLNELDERMDGVTASMHAITNARPFVQEGEFAMGAGVGFAGSKEAVAVGGAMGLTDNLSASFTVNYESSGTYSRSQVSGGAGLQYTFK
ncbi:YadA C-terminal domain-containing protein [Vibrio sp. ZSDZ34]|uniref:YadA C-terminal domain-containing protein n=1 Tax=Vibrio gelatinilyticus TaxID=2893468 RepID=A0A9X2AW02_9VIBR|nr:YadA C-terminal domain-containing protein [Vibrio gelatinilyticus]MCJ2376885.1 YadA C-terminal domain-containing protein [Vibrio gelatinilyticus]